MMIGVAQVMGMKPTLRSFFDGAALRKHLGRALEREELRQRRKRGRGADRLEERAARRILREHRAHHRRRDHALVARLVAFDRNALQLTPRRVVLGLADMPPATASAGLEATIGIEWIVERGHARSVVGRQVDRLAQRFCNGRAKGRAAATS
jgi:hypothetical protein